VRDLDPNRRANVVGEGLQQTIARAAMAAYFCWVEPPSGSRRLASVFSSYRLAEI